MLHTAKLRFQFDNPTSAELIGLLCKDTNLKRLGFLTACLDMFSNGKPLCESWEHAVTSDINIMRNISDSEKDALISFGSLLGTTDTSGQLMICEKCLQQFDENRLRAQNERARLGKVYISLGISGAFTVLILLC